MNKQHVQAAVRALDSKKAVNIKIIEIEKLTTLADCFIICNGTSSTHVRTLADECEAAMDAIAHPVIHREGMDAGSWILLDYGDMIVHIYNREARAFYDLERFWKDGTELSTEEFLENK